MSDERCVSCGHAFGKGERDPLGRANTPRGPMHFGCYWKLRDQAARDALAQAPAAVGGRE